MQKDSKRRVNHSPRYAQQDRACCAGETALGACRKVWAKAIRPPKDGELRWLIA